MTNGQSTPPDAAKPIESRDAMPPTTPYACRIGTPSVETYQRLRQGSGLSPKSAEAATRGLAGTLFAVQIVLDGEPVGMGRVVGDGGSFFQVVDIAVLKPHQGRGLGKTIMVEIMKYLEQNVPETGCVSLIADGKAKDLYAQFGFVPTAPLSIGMALKKPA